MARCLSTDRKSTRLNSSHLGISYAVFCLKKKETYLRCDPDRPTWWFVLMWLLSAGRANAPGSAPPPVAWYRRRRCCPRRVFFFFNDPATPEISPLSLPAPLPI